MTRATDILDQLDQLHAGQELTLWHQRRYLEQLRSELTPPPPIGVGMGGNIGDPDQAPRIAAAGIRHVRWALTWPACWDSRNNRLVMPPRILAWSDALAALGIEQTVCLTYTPARYGRGSQFDTPGDMTAWAAFVAFARDQLPAVRRWEVWNEPNHGAPPNIVPGLFPIRDRVREYGQLVIAATDQLPHSDTILVGALSPAPDKPPGAMNPVTFVEALYRLHPTIGRRFDRLSDHPYSGNQPLGVVAPWAHVSTQIPDMLAVMAAAGDGGKLVDGTEAGWRTAAPGQPPDGKEVTEARHAELVVDAVHTWRAQPWAGVLFLFSWSDLRDGLRYGLTRADGSPKPALGALADLLGGTVA